MGNERFGWQDDDVELIEAPEDEELEEVEPQAVKPRTPTTPRILTPPAPK